MKKRLFKIGFVILSIFALTGCSYIYDLIFGDSSEYSSSSSGSSSQPSSSSSRSSSKSSSTTSSKSSVNSSSSNNSTSQSSSSSSQGEDHSNELKAPSYNYMDFVHNNAYNISSTPCIGTPKILVIPVWFSNSDTFISTAKKASVREDIEKAYFGTNEETGWRSVKSFYYEESHGALTLNGKVSEWYECSSTYSTYRTDDGAVTKTCALAKTVTDWYFDNHDESRKDYDYDGDGYLDGVMLIYAAPDYGSLNKDSYTNLWAYCFWAGQSLPPSVESPILNAFFWASYDFMYGSNASSRTGKTTYAGGDTKYCSIDAHTFIHEMGHMFGLEDYYDYSSKSYDPAGSFSMQDHNVGGHDPFSAYALGWAKAYVPTRSITLELKPFTSSGEVIVLSPSFNSYNSPFDEYILIEYYTPTGLNEFDVQHQYQSRYPKGASVGGIRLWHVDARLAYASNGTFAPYKLTSNPKYTPSQGVVLAMSNTYDDGKEETAGYLSVLGSNYYNYNVLQMIRNNTTTTYTPTREKDALSNNTLFKAGSFFSMDTYGKQFVNRGKLNADKALGFTFNVDSITDSGATITINKL